MDIYMTRGDTKEIDIAVVVENEAKDLSGCTLTFTAKLLPSDAVGVITKTSSTPSGGITIVEEEEGLATLLLEPADTRDMGVTNPTSRGVFYAPTLSWDLQLTDSSGNIYTINQGKLIIQADITTPEPTP